MTGPEEPIFQAASPGPWVELRWAERGRPELWSDGGRVSPGPAGVAFWIHGRLDGEPAPAWNTRVVDLWRSRGSMGLGDLRGSFALVLVDEPAGIALAVRDPLGMTPLFYGAARDRIRLSPDIGSLLASEGIEGDLNRVALGEMLLDVPSDVCETVYEGIRRVPGGCCRQWRAPGIGECTRVWDPLPVEGSIRWIETPPRRLRQELEERLERVVARHRKLQEDGRHGIFLSSGIDSVTLAALSTREARAAGESPPLALSLLFPHPSVDESVEQRHVARMLGLEHVVQPMDGTRPGEGLLASSLALEMTWPQPLLNSWLPAYGRLAREGRERRVSSVWTGMGGDEWLSVTPLWAAELWRRGRPDEVVRLYRAYVRSQRLPRRELIWNLLWCCGLRRVLAVPARRWLARFAPGYLERRGHRRFEALAPSWLLPERALRREVRDRVAAVRPLAEGGEYLAEMRRGLYHPISAMELEETWEAGRRIGVAWLHPLLDADLVGWLALVPPRALLSGDWSKGLARDLLGESFPDLGVDRLSKPHAGMLFRRRVLEEAPACLRAAGPFPALDELGLIDGKTAADTFRRLLGRPETMGPPEVQRLWQALHLEAWVSGRLQ